MSSLLERIETLKDTLVKGFGYKRKEAQQIAEEAMNNLDRHVSLQETMIKRVMENRKK